MGRIWMPGGGGGGDGSDDCTITLPDVPKGLKAVTADSDDEAREGTLDTTTTAADSHVLAGETYMKFNPAQKHWEKRTGGQANRGAWTGRIGANGKIAIPAGNHNGSGYVDQSIPVIYGQTITPQRYQQVVSSNNKYMAGDLVVSGVNIFKTASKTVKCINLKNFTAIDGKTEALPCLQVGFPDFVHIASLVAFTIGSTAVYAFVIQDYISCGTPARQYNRTSPGILLYPPSIELPITKFDADYHVLVTGY